VLEVLDLVEDGHELSGLLPELDVDSGEIVGSFPGVVCRLLLIGDLSFDLGELDFDLREAREKREKVRSGENDGTMRRKREGETNRL